MLRLPHLSVASSVVDQAGKPNGTFILWWQQVVSRIEQAINLIVELTGIQAQFEQALQQAQAATQAAQDAADAAQTAAEAAQAQADAAKRESSLNASYITPESVLTADGSTLTIAVAAHTRVYGDGTSVSVNAGTVAATATGDVDYVIYDDPTRAGGAVTYVVVLDTPAQTGNTHVVGAVTIPATGSSGGGKGPRPPGYVEP